MFFFFEKNGNKYELKERPEREEPLLKASREEWLEFKESLSAKKMECSSNKEMKVTQDEHFKRIHPLMRYYNHFTGNLLGKKKQSSEAEEGNYNPPIPRIESKLTPR